MRKLRFKLPKHVFPIYGTDYTTCIGGCDPMFNELLNVRNESIRSQTQANDSGYRSMFDGTIGLNSTAAGTASTARPFSNIENKSRASKSSASKSSASIGLVRNQKSDSNRNNIRESRNIKQQSNSENNTWTNTSNVNPRANKTNLPKNVQDKVWGVMDKDAIILCSCNENAIQLTVKKEGPNHGKNVSCKFMKNLSLNMIYYNHCFIKYFRKRILQMCKTSKCCL